ncbi:MAG TPA: hypothetical protein VIK25_07360 [Gemmatimonadaceae bacterium]
MRLQPAQVLPQELLASAGCGVFARFLPSITSSVLVHAARLIVREEQAEPGAGRSWMFVARTK